MASIERSWTARALLSLVGRFGVLSRKMEAAMTSLDEDGGWRARHDVL